jgi:DNA-binding transcriptional MerR regulator
MNDSPSRNDPPGSDGPQHTVEELAAATDTSIDTIRYYQRIGLLSAPARNGRRASYSDTQRSALQRIRELAASGFSLAQIGTLLETRADPLVVALAAHEQSGLSRAELASRTGLDLSTIDLVIEAGLIRPDELAEGERFDPSAVTMLQAARDLIEAGIPLQDLYELALTHTAHIETIVDEAVNLFRSRIVSENDRTESAHMTRALVPVVTRLVAEHFSRTLIERALDALDGPTESASLDVSVSWSDET